MYRIICFLHFVQRLRSLSTEIMTVGSIIQKFNISYTGNKKNFAPLCPPEKAQGGKAPNAPPPCPPLIDFFVERLALNL